MNRIHLALPALALSLTALSACKEEAPPVAEESTAAPEATPAARQSALDWARANYKDEGSGEFGKPLYAEAAVDLDGDGEDEALVYLGGPMLCGTGGCDMVVLKRDGEGWRKVGDMSVVQLPVGVLESRSNGWRDLVVTVAGGGQPAARMKLMFDGSAYPDNPTVAPAVETASIGQELIPQKPLKPLD